MELLVHAAARLVRSAMVAWTRKWTFLSVALLVFLGSVFALWRLDFLPEAKTSDRAITARPAQVSAAVAELPMKIEIPSIDLSATIANPETTDIPTLDHALLSGAVRYPTSGKLGQDNTNVVLFGHSSYLPIVHNQAFKAFNGIQKLHTGDSIIVYSSGTAYTYVVKSVSKESANDAGIPLVVTGRQLTLATCDSFAKKSDRFVVVADFVESRVISG